MLTAETLMQILSDNSLMDLKKLSYKYGKSAVAEALGLFQAFLYDRIPLLDFSGKDVVYLDTILEIRLSTYKALLANPGYDMKYSLLQMESEIASTLGIENIFAGRESIRFILSGSAPQSDGEKKVYGLKRGLDYIANPNNRITEENCSFLYSIAISPSLDEGDKLLPGHFYRHDRVFLTNGTTIEHEGLDHRKLPGYLKRFFEFIRQENLKNDILKSVVIHFYLAYLHPYFDGNGRMARLLNLWYLVQRGYTSAMYYSFSALIQLSKAAYYRAFETVERNAVISGVLDITPFLVYFIDNVFNKLESQRVDEIVLDHYRQALNSGQVTEKEAKLFSFVLSVYGDSEFSIKQLERDFKEASYSTIRSFVLKFSELGILIARKYGNRTKYRLSG